jgi:hypothetical protein
MRQDAPGHGEPIGPQDWHKLLPSEPAPASDRLEWAGMEAASAPAGRRLPRSSTGAP